MTDIKIFLKILKRFGYPKPNPNTKSIAKLSGYLLPNFLIDIKKEYGNEFTTQFVKNATDGFLGPEKILKLDLTPLAYGPSYGTFLIEPFEYDPSFGSHGIYCRYYPLESKIFWDNNLNTKTFKEIFDDCLEKDLNNIWEYFVSDVEKIISSYVYDNLGFEIYFYDENWF
jgi:hypothetical protein